MNFGEQLKRIRRYLRDPDGNIWSRALLKNLFNDVQRDIQHKTWVLEDVRALRIPPLYHCAYLFDWEWAYLSSAESVFYKALRERQQADEVVCYRFEAQAENSGDANDEGEHFTQPWEAFVSGAPGELVRYRFPSDFYATVWMAHDRKPIDALNKKLVQQEDSSYLTRTGIPFGYYRDDTVDNSFVLYPFPSSVVWDDLDESPASADFVYIFDFEEEGDYLSGIGEQLTTEDSSAVTQYIYSWETGTYTGEDLVGHGMWLFEATTDVGMVVHVTTDTTLDEAGTLVRRTGSLASSEYGITVDVVDAEDQLLLIYDQMPADIAADDETTSFPTFLQKYIEQGVLARAYRVDNDGRIQSLSDYWEYRFTVSLEAIKRFLIMRRADRDYVLMTRTTSARIARRHPSLPSTYPAV